MWSTAEWMTASHRTLSARSDLLKGIDKTVAAYGSVKARQPDDLVLRVYALDLVIAAIDRWWSDGGRTSKRRESVLTLYNAAKLERNLLKTRLSGEAAARAAEEQKKLIASIQGTLSQMLTPPPPKPKIGPPVPSTPPPLTPQQKKETDEAITNARKEILATSVGQHLLAELTKRRLKLIGVSGDDTSKLDKEERQAVIDDLPKIQLGYLTAKSILKLDGLLADRKEIARGEGIRILAYMLGNSKQVADAFLQKNFEVVVVPKDQYMTDLVEFSALRGTNTFDGRLWNNVRGAGYVFETPTGSEPHDVVDYMNQQKKIFVAVTEESLIGERFAPTNRGYTCGYSTTLHEFAHTIDRFALTAEQRDLLDKLYKKKRSDAAGNELTTVLSGGTTWIYFDGNPADIPEILNREWADGPRTSLTGPAADYRVLGSKGGNRWKLATGTAPQSLLTVNLPTVPKDCYAGCHRLEYFAQTVCAYFGANTGNEPTTKRPRNNGRSWVAANEPKEFLDLLDDLFGHGRYLLDDMNLVDQPKEARWWEK